MKRQGNHDILRLHAKYAVSSVQIVENIFRDTADTSLKIAMRKKSTQSSLKQLF